MPREEDGAPSSDSTPVSPTAVAANRYQAPPAMIIDTSKRYMATIRTSKGDITLELYPDEAPLAVNAFVFLAQDGFYNGSPFMQLVKNPDGSRFTIQAGDPTRTGLGTPGYSVSKERTSPPFGRGAVGMGGAAENSNGGQFFISPSDYPSLTGKYTIFGRVISGFEVLDRLSLLDLTKGRSAGGPADEIQAVTISVQ